MKDYDLVILGGGSAGYNAASTAVSLGLRVAVIEGGDEVGGLCILRGCMPSKTLLESASRYLTLRRASEFGLSTGEISYSAEDILKRKNHLVADFAGYRAKQLESGRFAFFRGWASFTDPHTVEITPLSGENQAPRQITSETFLLATGSHIKAVPLPGLAEVGYWDSDTALRTAQIPKSLIILGGGATAVEFAHYYSALGCAVTIIQRSEQLLKDADGDIANSLASAYAKRGIAVYCNTHLEQAEWVPSNDPGEPGIKRITFTHAGKRHTVEAQEILYALGREPQVSGLNLDRAGLQVSRNRLTVGPSQQTDVPHIFAAGDVAGPYEIVHIAIQQGELAARNAARLVRGMAGQSSGKILEEIDFRLRLFVVFSSPEIGMVGFTERELQAMAIPYRVACYPFDDHGKSMVMGETEGLVKLIVSEENKEILGAAVIGPHASELIHEVVVAMRFRATARDLAAIPHYHPTLSEIWTYPAEELA